MTSTNYISIKMSGIFPYASMGMEYWGAAKKDFEEVRFLSYDGKRNNQ